MATITVTDTSDRATIAAAVAVLKRKYDRMPAHWEARRLEVMREIDRLVDQWLAASA